MAFLGDVEVVVFGPGGKPLPEFEDENADEVLKNVQGPAVVKYLQAQADTNFSITCKIRSGHSIPASSSISFRVFRDDDEKSITKRLARAGRLSASGWGSSCDSRRSHDPQGWQTQSFRFGCLEMEADELTNTTQDGKFKIGTLRIEVWEVSVIGRSNITCRVLGANKKQYSEVDLKGATVDLSLQLDEAKPTSARVLWTTKGVGKWPLATLFLKYRTRETLQQIGVLEISPSTVTIDSDNSDNPVSGNDSIAGNGGNPDDDNGNLIAPNTARTEVGQIETRGTKRKPSSDLVRAKAKHYTFEGIQHYASKDLEVSNCMGEWQLLPFKFDALNKCQDVDKKTELQLLGKSGELGCIKVQVYRFEKTGIIERPASKRPSLLTNTPSRCWTSSHARQHRSRSRIAHLAQLTTEQLHEVILGQRKQLEQIGSKPKKEEPDIKPRIQADGTGGADKPIFLDDDDDTDNESEIEVLEVVNLARKRKAGVLDISDDDAS